MLCKEHRFGKPTEKAKVRRLETFRVDTFSGARWEFHADGTISFQPSVTNLMGLYPLIGRFSVTESGITFHVSKQASAGVAVTLDGILRPSERGYSLVAINTTAGRSGLHIDRISQQLDPSPGKEPAAERLIGGISLPSTFAVSIMGTTDEIEVGPVAGTLTIEPADLEAPYPLLISLSSPDLTVPGAIQWTVSPALAPQAKVSIANGRLTLEVEFDQPGLLLWIAAVPESPIPDLALPFAIRHGRMVLAVDRDKVSGSLAATGVSPVFESREGTYNVQFTGQRQEEKGAVPTHPEQGLALDSRHLQFPVFDLDFPIFDITLNGETECGTFEDLAATLIISRTEPEVFELMLATEGPTRNGWIAWTSESLDRITHLQGNRITAAYPDDESPDVSWWTGDGTSVDLVYAIPERARIAIIIGQDAEITGTIEGTGNAAVHEQLKPSFYRANFRPLAWAGCRSAGKTLNQAGLNGSWQDAGAFGTLVLRVENGRTQRCLWQPRGRYPRGRLAGSLCRLHVARPKWAPRLGVLGAGSQSGDAGGPMGGERRHWGDRESSRRPHPASAESTCARLTRKDVTELRPTLAANW